ncbi:MAG: FtsQ-type POTRA domain-containing protein [bacterium]|nr:FtsQ-type POTRA domain-containing protein [bacterium]
MIPSDPFACPRDGQASRRRRANRRLPVMFGLAALAVAGVILFLDSGFFEVREVTVAGLRLVAEEEILALSGIRPRTSTWRLSLLSIQRGVESHPRVKRATITRDLPRGLLITIEERSAVAVIPYYASFLEVDASGQVLGLAAGVPRHPVITGLLLRRAVPGDDLSERLRPGLEVLEHLGPGEAGLVAEVHLAETGEVIAYTADATTVYLGLPQAMGPKVSALLAVVEELAFAGSRAEYIDLRNPGRPLVKLRDGK